MTTFNIYGLMWEAPDALLTAPVVNNVNIYGTMELSNNYSFNPAMDLRIYNGATLTHLTNGGADYFDVTLAAANITIDAGGYINVIGRGYAGWGTRGHCFYGAGGGSGGTGGSASDAGSSAYGSLTQPVDIGGAGHGSCGCFGAPAVTEAVLSSLPYQAPLPLTAP